MRRNTAIVGDKDLIDVQKLLGQFLGSQHSSSGHHRPNTHGGGLGQGGGFLGGSGGSVVSAALASGLASKLFRAKGLGSMGGSAGRYGSAALVAGLAYKAFQAYQQNRGSPAANASVPATSQGFGELPQAAGTPFLPEGQEDRRARLMLSAMIAAAKADGYIDQAEQEAIFGRIDQAGLDAEEKGYLMDEMRKPASIDALVAEVRVSEEAVEVYTASLLAIDPDHPAERAYLDLLAARLNLDPSLVSEIRRTTDAARAS